MWTKRVALIAPVGRRRHRGLGAGAVRGVAGPILQLLLGRNSHWLQTRTAGCPFFPAQLNSLGTIMQVTHNISAVAVSFPGFCGSKLSLRFLPTFFPLSVLSSFSSSGGGKEKIIKKVNAWEDVAHYIGIWKTIYFKELTVSLKLLLMRVEL